MKNIESLIWNNTLLCKVFVNALVISSRCLVFVMLKGGRHCYCEWFDSILRIQRTIARYDVAVKWESLKTIYLYISWCDCKTSFGLCWIIVGFTLIHIAYLQKASVLVNCLKYCEMQAQHKFEQGIRQQYRHLSPSHTILPFPGNKTSNGFLMMMMVMATVHSRGIVTLHYLFRKAPACLGSAPPYREIPSRCGNWALCITFFSQNFSRNFQFFSFFCFLEAIGDFSMKFDVFNRWFHIEDVTIYTCIALDRALELWQVFYTYIYKYTYTHTFPYTFWFLVVVFCFTF